METAYDAMKSMLSIFWKMKTASQNQTTPDGEGRFWQTRVTIENLDWSDLLTRYERSENILLY